MSVPLRCPNCYDNLGKTVENSVDAYCGTCGTAFFNPDGYIQDKKHLEQVKKKYPKHKLPKPENDE